MGKSRRSSGVGPRLLSGASFGPPPGKGDDEAVLEDYLAEVSQYPVLPHEEQTVLAVAAQEGDQAAGHRLIRSNLRLVLAMSVRYRGRGLPLADLIQEGNHGLMQAISRFKASKQVRFSTYSLWWIRQALERSVANQARTIRLPIHFRERVIRLRRAREALLRHLGHEPDLEDLAKEVGLSVKKVKEALRNQHDALSLDVRPRGGGSDDMDGSALHERISATENLDPGRFLNDSEKQRDVRWMLRCLEPRERTVLERRYGLSDGKSRTLEQVGKTMQITRERVRQIEAKALQKLRGPEVAQRLQVYV
jgi:RNA polymerase primary sigma factor